jgi:2-(1,2-epoxy-1,2-dihydrophenyl)acetyl-CoA isomerase
MLGDSIDAATAAGWGMIWRAVEDKALEAEAEVLAARLAKAPAGALASIKVLFAAASGASLDRQLDLEAALQGEAGRSADFVEGVAAFKEKRPARFGG